jgi:hypothetical protein
MELLEHLEFGSPQARSDGLLRREVRDGVVVYDEQRHRAHSLNPTAALIWSHCDGKTSVPEMAALLPQKLNLPADEEIVWLALDHLEKAHLLAGPLGRTQSREAVSRRAMIRKLGIAAGMTAVLPLVTSISASAKKSYGSADKVKGNNGLGNGVDPQPPGNPKPNDLDPDKGPHG